MGELIIPGVNDQGVDDVDDVEEITEPLPVDEDWKLLEALVHQIDQFEDTTDEEKALHLDLALSRHVNQQKIMNYSRLNECNPMAFIDPMTMFSIRLDGFIDLLIGENGVKRLEFEVEAERRITDHIDGMAMSMSKQRTQALNPDTAGLQVGLDSQGKVVVTGENRQQRRQRARQISKQVTKHRGQ